MDSLDLLKKLVSFDSVFPRESELAHYLAEELKKFGFSVELQKWGENRYNVLATRGTKGKPILLYGHMDTVPAYGYDIVGRNPQTIVEKDGKLYGLGAYDMKAGIAAILKSVEETKGNDRAIKIMFVSDEEADSTGAYEVSKTDFFKDVDVAIATEISDVHDLNEKTRAITLGRRGRIQYEIKVPGKSFHAARLEHGISAVTEASKLAIELEKMNAQLPKHPKLSHGSQHVRKFYSESLSLSIPDEAIILLDRHLVPPETIESARLEIEKMINDLYKKGIMKEADGKRATISVKKRYVPYMTPYTTPENNPHVEQLAKTIEKKLGSKANFNYGMSVADENLIAMQGIPVISYGPIGEGEHSNNEWVSKKSYLELIEVLKSFLSS
ncbi:M20/M25/M40 family metallo-hydrolase [Candidatus Micrarchaeota archaeon]|nr:M20/M25/M40 family metallo-hydrolase [Candidatus Micrarchaeota archaeon]